MPVQSLPIDICQDIAAYIHHKAGKGPAPYTRNTARATHAQLSLASKAWLELSRRIFFEEVSVIYAYKIAKLLELIEDSKGACTFLNHIRVISFGEAEPSVRPSNGGNYPYGWLGDYFDFKAALPLFPNLHTITFNCIFASAGLPYIREFHRLESILTSRSPLTNISQLSVRLEFFDGLAAVYDFLHDFPGLHGLTMRGITAAFLRTIPYHLPTTVQHLKLVENEGCTALGEAFLRPCTKPIRQLARADVVLHRVQYVHLAADRSLHGEADRVPFLVRMSEHTSVLQVFLPRRSNEETRAWSFLEKSKLHEKIDHGIADVTFFYRSCRWTYTLTPDQIPFHDDYQFAASCRLEKLNKAISGEGTDSESGSEDGTDSSY